MAMKIAGYFVTDKLLLEHGLTELQLMKVLE